MEFPPKHYHYEIILLLTRKEKLPKCQEIPISSAGGKKHLIIMLLPLVDATFREKKIPIETRLAAIDYLDRKRCSRSFFHSKMADFVLPVTLSSADSYSVSPRLRLLVSKPKPTKQKCSGKVLTQQLKEQNGHLPP